MSNHRVRYSYAHAFTRQFILVACACALFILTMPGTRTQAQLGAPNGALTQQATLTASDGAKGDSFGTGVAISDDGHTALVANYTKTIGANAQQGAVYVYTSSDGKWTEQVQLLAKDGVAFDRFGSSITISADGNTALIGTGQKTVNGIKEKAVAYVFAATGGTWTQTAVLSVPDDIRTNGFSTGLALSADGTLALIGDPLRRVKGDNAVGAVYAFTLKDGIWSQQAELLASDGELAASFGNSVSLSASGGTALIGAYLKGVAGNATLGAVYVFTATNGKWTQGATLAPKIAAGIQGFGTAVRLSSDGGTALVHSAGKMISISVSAGRTYLFTAQGEKWSQQGELSAREGGVDVQFGDSAALSANGNTVLIGSPYKNETVYLFTRNKGKWTQAAKMSATGGKAGDGFGGSVALSADGTTALVAAKNNAASGSGGEGEVFVFGKSK